MARLIAFDQKTAAALRQQLPHDQIFEHGATDVADYVAGGPETLVAVLPVDAPGEAGVAVFRRVRVERPAAQPMQASTSSMRKQEASGAIETSEPINAIAPESPVAGSSPQTPGQGLPEQPGKSIKNTEFRIRAGGFLGLRDEAVFEEEEKPLTKQSWWRKFWDEE